MAIAVPGMSLLLALAFASCGPRQSSSRANPAPKATSSPSSTPAPDLPSATPALQPSATPVLQPSATLRPACQEAEGQLLEGSYPGFVYSREIPFLIYLPPCYAEGVVGYPAVYLLHGYPYDETHWVDLGLLEAYELGVANDDWPRVIFVLPYIPEPLFTHSDGGVGSYEQEFVEGLLPAIETQYRVLPNADMRVLGGVSRGGVWALEIGLRNTDLIHHTAAMSPALVNNHPRLEYDPFQLVLEDRRFPETLFLSTGENETPFREKIEAFIELLELQGIEHSFLLHPGIHSDETWRAIIEEILVQLLVGVTP